MRLPPSALSLMVPSLPSRLDLRYMFNRVSLWQFFDIAWTVRNAQQFHIPCPGQIAPFNHPNSYTQSIQAKFQWYSQPHSSPLGAIWLLDLAGLP